MAETQNPYEREEEYSKLTNLYEMATTEELKDFYTRAGELSALIPHIVSLFCPNDEELRKIIEEKVSPKIIAENRKLCYINLNSKLGQKTLSLLRNTASGLLEED